MFAVVALLVFSVEGSRPHMWNYLLPLGTALVALLQLAKDWKAHAHPWRRGSLLILIIVLAIGTVINNHRSAKRAADEHTKDQQRIIDLQTSVTAMQGQIDNLVKTSTYNAQRDSLAHELKSIHDDLRAGFSKLGVAIKAHGGQAAPPTVPHLRIVQRPTPAKTDAAPYGLQVILQPDMQVPASFRVICDGPITDADFYVAGQSAYMGVRTERGDNSFAVSISFPPIDPKNPLVLNLYSKTTIHVTKVERLPQ